MNVLVTGGGGLAALITAAGGRAVAVPTVTVAAVAPSPAVLAAVARCEMAVFVSVNAVRHGAALVAAAAPAVTFTAVGEATAQALQAAVAATVLHPATGQGSAALLALPPMHAVHGKRITVVRGVGGLREPARTLRRRGATVVLFNCYRRSLADTKLAPLLTAGVDSVTVTSATHARNLFALADDAARDVLRRLHFIAPSARVAKACRDLGVHAVSVADGAGDAAMLAALCATFPRCD